MSRVRQTLEQLAGKQLSQQAGSSKPKSKMKKSKNSKKRKY